MKQTTLRKVFALMGTLILTLPILLGFVGMPEVKAAEATQKVTLHKRALLETEKPADGIVNDGTIKNDFPGKPLPGVVFTAYDVTSLYNQARKANKSAAEAFEDLKSATTTGLTTYTFEATNNEGQSSLNLPVGSTVDGKTMNAVYLIKETSAPTSVVQASNIVIALPFYNKGTTTPMTEVNLYPKNYQIQKTLEFTKYSADSNGDDEKVLAGAKFVLKNANNQYLKTTPLASGLPDFSGSSATDTDVREFVSGQDGKVVAADLALENGTYTFEETTSVEGFHKTNVSDKIVEATVNNKAVSYKYYDAKGQEVTNATSAKAYNYSVPNPVKTVDKNQADMDQVLNYTATLQIPTDASSYTKFDLVDTPNEHLALLSDLSKLKATIAGTNIVLNTTPVLDKTNGFRFSFYQDATDKANIIANIGKKIEIKFEMAIKEGAVIDAPITNELKFDNDFKESTGTVDVQTHGKKFVKEDAYKGTKLAGAEFLVLRNNKGQTEYLTRAYDAPGKEHSWSTDRNDKNRVVLKSDAQGQFEITGLVTGDYQLEEIKAPTGYQLPVQPLFDFTVTETSYTKADQVLSVLNSENGVLPSTGGKGIISFIAVGLVAMIIGGVYFYRRHQLA